MSSMTVEMGKRYKTRDGLPVRILATDAVGGSPIIALVKCLDGVERVMRHDRYGVCVAPPVSDFDLVEDDRTPLESWLNRYEGSDT